MSDWLSEIKERWAAATPGPWAWRGNSRIQEIYLNCQANDRVDEVYRPYIMQFVRWGMRGGQPRFRGERAMEKVSDGRIVLEVPYRGDIIAIDHPDAVAIAAAPADVARLVEEVEQLRAELAASS